jgi:hypothetical protein
VASLPLDFFLAHRVAVFPICEGSKAPAVPKGTDWADWDDFQRSRPDGSYGVVLGSLMVIDGDSQASTAWIRANVPPTPFRVQSGPHHDRSRGRGVHFYFRAPQRVTPAFIHRDHLVIEARRRGQYVVGPGSVHPSGCTYRVSTWSWRWDDLPVFPAEFLFDDGTGHTSAAGAPYEPPERMVAGERTHELFRLLRHMKALGASIEETRYCVELYNRNRCEPPKSDSWLRSWFPRAWNLADRPGFSALPQASIDLSKVAYE